MSRVEVLLPKWGLTMTEATVVRWLKSPGDTVAKDEPIVEVETEKADAEVESPATGTLVEIIHAAGSVVDVGNALGVLEVESGAAAAATAPPTEGPAPVAAEARPSAEAALPGRPPAGAAERKGPRASPVARRAARELGVELGTVVGSGARGLITEGDVRAAAESSGVSAASSADASAPASELRVGAKEPLRGRRKAIGEALSRDLSTSPQVTLTRSADASGLQALRQTTHGDYSVNDLLIAATAAALQRHPALNAHLVDGEIWTFDDVNMGLAVDLEGGLIVPVLRGAGTLGLGGIRNERLRLVEGVRSGTTTPTELMDGTFTITNLGAWNIDAFTPIINPPQVAILGVGRMVDRPAAINGGLVVRPEMVLSATFDHRALDGRGAAEFLDELCTLLASAERLGELVGAGSTPR